MLTTIDQMPENARLWVYQANRKLNEQEITKLKDFTSKFAGEWLAHGSPLKASYEIKFNQFLIITVDESYNPAGGCSIDDSVRFIQYLEQQIGISFLDRSKVAFLVEDEILLKPISLIKEAIQNREISEQAKVINNSVSSFKDFKESWIQPVQDSWLKKYFI